ncbi:MAG TPA: gephyrin-like molybdotransferase Glp [Balneolales bacterium]|nr:gephyrin-like molybdotransferase Glp [Balneolales bacterium]
MISFQEAQSILKKEFSNLNLETEQVDLVDSVGRILAEDIYSDINLPPFDNSAMDGIAIHFTPGRGEWKIVGEISAGKFSDVRIDDNSAVTIMTGARLPDRCDTVIPVEDIEIDDDHVSLQEGIRLVKGMNLRKQGNDLVKGKVALTGNTLLKPHHIAVAASCGQSKVNVYKRLRIGVLATGDELVDVDETPAGDKIRCSNLYSLLSAVQAMNMEPVNLGMAKDDKQLIYDRIKSGLDNNLDILITTGGVSVGKYDYVMEVHKKLGIDIKFWRVSIKPGKPVLFGVYNHDGKTTLVFGLPGNPVSCLVNFLVFAQENIYSLFDLDITQKIVATLDGDLKKEDSKRHFMRGFCTYADGKYRAEKIGSQSSGNLAEMGKANCLIVVEEDRTNPQKGELVECIMI